jgi:hypothetical protein
MSGASVRSLDLFTKICGLSNMRNAMIVTNMWSYPADPEEDRRDLQLQREFFKAPIEHGARTAKRGGTGSQSAHAIVQRLMHLHPIELQMQRELAIEHKLLDETEAGMLVDRNLRVRLERQQREKEELEEELEMAREERDRRAQDQLERYKRDREEEERRLLEQIELLQEDRRNLPSNSGQATFNPNMARDSYSVPEFIESEQNGGGGGRPGTFSRWTPKMFQPQTARPVVGRGREPVGAPRSATSGNGRSL